MEFKFSLVAHLRRFLMFTIFLLVAPLQATNQPVIPPFQQMPVEPPMVARSHPRPISSQPSEEDGLDEDGDDKSTRPRAQQDELDILLTDVLREELHGQASPGMRRNLKAYLGMVDQMGRHLVLKSALEQLKEIGLTERSVRQDKTQWLIFKWARIFWLYTTVQTRLQENSVWESQVNKMVTKSFVHLTLAIQRASLLPEEKQKLFLILLNASPAAKINLELYREKLAKIDAAQFAQFNTEARQTAFEAERSRTIPFWLLATPLATGALGYLAAGPGAVLSGAVAGLIIATAPLIAKTHESIPKSKGAPSAVQIASEEEQFAVELADTTRATFAQACIEITGPQDTLKGQ